MPVSDGVCLVPMFGVITNLAKGVIFTKPFYMLSGVSPTLFTSKVPIDSTTLSVLASQHN